MISIPFAIATKNKNKIQINLTKKVKDLCTENYKTVMKNIADTNWKISCVYGLEEWKL